MQMPASSDTTGAVEAGELIVGFLKQIGIKVQLLPATDTKMNDYWGSGDFDAYIWYWSGDPDPNYQLFVFTSEQCGYWSDGCWKDPHFDQLYEEQRSMMDQTQRQQIVLEAQQYEYDQVPGVVLAYPNWLEAYRNDQFTGWIPSPGPQGYLLATYNYDTLLAVKPVTRLVQQSARRRCRAGSGPSPRSPWWGSSCSWSVADAAPSPTKPEGVERMGSRRYLLSKTLQAVVTLWFVLTFNFFLFRILPGDPVAVLARSEKLTPDDIARLQHDLGLDRPILQQYAIYMRQTLTGDLGQSLRTGEQVKDMIGARFLPTVVLVGRRHAPGQRVRDRDRHRGGLAAREHVRHHLAVQLA